MAQGDQADFYDKASPFRHDVVDVRIERISRFLEATLRRAEGKGRRVESALDVGCANGALLSTFPPSVRRVGVDIARELLALATARGIETYLCDVDEEPLPFPDASFDCVLSTDVLEHVLHTDKVVNEINRVLRPQGLWIAAIPNVNQPVSFLMQFFLDLTPMFASRYRCPHYRDFTARLFRLIAIRHGFAIERVEGSFIYPFFRSRLSRGLAKVVPRWGSQVIFSLRKALDVTVEEGYCENMPGLLRWFRATSPNRNDAPSSGP